MTCIPPFFLSRRALVGLGLLGAMGISRASAPISSTAQQLLRWVQASGDATGRAFVVIDKPEARMHLFAAAGQWQASSPVLLGAARGDRTVPGIGNRPLNQIAPHERTTPAGRFLTEPGRNLQGEDLVWIDYEGAVSLHRVRSHHPSERRLERLASPRVTDRRISWGCINAPTAFYNQWLAPTLGREPGLAYVLPDTESFATFFAAASAY